VPAKLFFADQSRHGMALGMCFGEGHVKPMTENIRRISIRRVELECWRTASGLPLLVEIVVWRGRGEYTSAGNVCGLHTLPDIREINCCMYLCIG
jgi:hypothetical protein